ncbi:putative Aminoglycoside phosphotransferase domain-containing protein [Seiridium cardinale]
MANMHMPPLNLPWVREEGGLPGPLPTSAEIEAATTEFPSIFDSRSRRTVLVNGRFVVKYGAVVFENEGHALLLLENMEVPTSRLYAMYREGEKLFIIMEFIPGVRLSDIWPALSEEEKEPIVAQLRRAFDCVRALPSPKTFSAVCGGPLPHRFFFSYQKKDPLISGPFDDERDISRALALKSRANWEEWGRRPWTSDFFSRHLATVLSGHESVFTHGDLQRKNILVLEQGDLSSGSGKSYLLTAIVDWESAGWYPSYWEYALCFTYFDWSDDWAEKIERILKPYVKEAALMRFVGQDLDA